MEALAGRHSTREFAGDALPLTLLSSLLWAACGVNRPDGGRTFPSALNVQEIDVYAALPSGQGCELFKMPFTAQRMHRMCNFGRTRCKNSTHAVSPNILSAP